MMRLGGPSPADAEEEARQANAAIVGTGLTYFAVCIAIHLSPYLIEQFGFEVCK